MSDAKNSLRVIIGSLAIGGAETHLCQVLPALVKKGFRVRLLVLSDKLDLLPRLENTGVTISHVTPSTDSNSLWGRLRRLWQNFLFLCGDFRKDRHTPTHFFLPEAYALGMLAALVTGLRAVKIMSRRCLNVYQKRRPLLGIIEPYLHKYTHAILGNSQRVLTQLQDEEHISPSKLDLIYNGLTLGDLPTPQERAQQRHALHLDKKGLVMMMVANLIPYKGHRDLISALSLLQSELPANWRLVLVGRDQGVQETLIQQVHLLGLTEHIIFLGPRSDAAQLWAAADIGILCSHEEGFSNAILEGMAAGLPMVVTDVGGNAEAVLDGKTGYVVPAKNPKALAAALQKLIQNPDLRQDMGAQGRARAEHSFSLDGCVDQYVSFYHRLLLQAS